LNSMYAACGFPFVPIIGVRLIEIYQSSA